MLGFYNQHTDGYLTRPKKWMTHYKAKSDGEFVLMYCEISSELYKFVTWVYNNYTSSSSKIYGQNFAYV